MKYRKLGNTDLDVSLIGLGTMTYGEQNSEADAHAQLDLALELGVNLVDTAEMYPVPPMAATQGLTEQYIGTWLAKTRRRKDIVLASKIAGPQRDPKRPGHIRNGGTSPIAGVVHALTLVLVLLFLAPLAANIPLATLAAILFMVAWNMSEVRHVVRMVKRAPRADVIILFVTFALTVFADLVVAVNIGVVLAMLHFLRRMAESVVVRQQDDASLQRELAQDGFNGLPPDVLVVQIGVLIRPANYRGVFDPEFIVSVPQAIFQLFAGHAVNIFIAFGVEL